MTLHYMLDFNDRVRVWTDEQARYGQFDVMDGDDFRTLQGLAKKYGWTLLEQYD